MKFTLTETYSNLLQFTSMDPIELIDYYLDYVGGLVGFSL